MPQPAAVPALTIDLDPKRLLKDWGVKSAKTLIESVERIRQRKLICLVMSEAPIPTALTPALVTPLSKTLRRLGKQPKLDLLLRTTGGMAEIPWRIVSLLREFTDELGVIVPTFAFSGGTHIAIAGDELLLTAFSALGSVDPTRNHPLLPPDGKGNPIPASVQDLKHCIEFIQGQMKDGASSQDRAQIVSDLFKYINPLALGALEQSYNLSRLITKKVLQTRKKSLSNEHIAQIQDTLAGQYFSHAFPISRAEVDSDLKLPVTKVEGPLLEAVLALEEHFVGEFARRMPIAGGGPPLVFGVGGFLQTEEYGFVIAQVPNLVDLWVEF